MLNNSSCPGNKQTKEECVKTHQSLVGPVPGEQADFILNWKLSIFEHWGLSCDRAWHLKIGIFALNKEGFGVSVDVPEVVCKGRQLRNRHLPMQMWFYKPTHYQNRNLIFSAIYTQLGKSQLWSLSLQEIEIYIVQYMWNLYYTVYFNWIHLILSIKL